MQPALREVARQAKAAGYFLLGGFSLLVLKRGGRLVTCGATSGPTVTFNLMQLFQQQYKIFGSFGASMKNIRDSLAKISKGMAPIIDTEVPLADLERGLARLESRQVFGKIIVTL